MCIYIGIEDLVANALIELVEKSEKREVLFKELDEYGALVIKYLNEKQEQAVLVLSKERTNDFLHDYSDYFELFSKGLDEGIRLKEGIATSELWEKFRGYLSVDVMLAFMDKMSVKALGVSVWIRLRNVIQTSYAPLYSSAVHNRFVHSLGVYYLGGIVSNTIESQKDELREIGDIDRYLIVFK